MSKTHTGGLTIAPLKSVLLPLLIAAVGYALTYILIAITSQRVRDNQEQAILRDAQEAVVEIPFDDDDEIHAAEQSHTNTQ